MGISSYESLKVRVSEDGLAAYLTLLPTDENVFFTKEQLADFLQTKKIVFGLDMDALARLAASPVPGGEICVARGIPPVDGQDGVLHYKFNTELSRKPMVNKDGTVDYRSLHLVETVDKGDVIAVATDPTDWKNGTMVTGQPVAARRGKPAPALRGRGYTVSADGHTYTAVLSGKIELVHGSVRISEVYELKGDAGLASGNIDFHGDVIIHGNVKPGVQIKATGSVTVDGTCENCTIEAGKDIVLCGGVLGGHKTIIKSQGNIHAKFFEYCKVQAEGTIDAESALDCVLDSHKTVSMLGKKAGLVGGVTYATEGIEAYTVGNSTEIRTLLQVGVKVELMREVFQAEKEKDAAEELIARINAGLKQYDSFAAEHGMDANQDEKRMTLFRTRMMKQAEAATLEKKIAHLQDIIARGKGATVEVTHDIYPGVTVMIDRSNNILRDKQTAVRFELDEESGTVLMLSHDGIYMSR